VATTPSKPQIVGDLLPTDLKSKYPPEVLNLTIEEAYAINQEGAQLPAGFSLQDSNDLEDIYEKYLKAPKSNSPTAAYWNKPAGTNKAIWSTK